MSEGPESPKSHHKLVLPENVPKSAFYTVILGEMDPIRWYLGQIWSKMAKNATLGLVSTNYPNIEIAFFGFYPLYPWYLIWFYIHIWRELEVTYHLYVNLLIFGSNFDKNGQKMLLWDWFPPLNHTMKSFFIGFLSFKFMVSIILYRKFTNQLY